MPLIEKIRELIKIESEQSKKSSDEDSLSSNKNLDEDLTEDEILDNLGLKNVARTSDGKIDHGKLSMKDRMAIVRGMRKRRKKMPGNSPNKTSEDAEDVIEDITEADINGFVHQLEKFEAKPPPAPPKSEFSSKFLRPLKAEKSLEDCNQPQFLANLGLFEPQEVDSLIDLIKEDGRAKIHYRNMTYIPEMSDKKHKLTYTYLAPDINSPPMLRTRQRRQVSNNNSNTASRMTSRSNSRATTPERSITRQLSSSNESETILLQPPAPLQQVTSKKALDLMGSEKASLETELDGLQKRQEELQSILGANKRTISTRVSEILLSLFKEKSQLLGRRVFLLSLFL